MTSPELKKSEVTSSQTRIAIEDKDFFTRLEGIQTPEYFSNCGEYQNIKFPYFQVSLLDKKHKTIKTLGFIKVQNKFRLLEMY